MITPFHFACFAEERLRAQCAAADAPLGKFLKISRRTSLSEHRAQLNFGPPFAEDFVTHATLDIQLVPQKDEKTALNCTLNCPSQKLNSHFRLLISNIEEAQPQIAPLFAFVQKAFAPLNYTTYVPSAAESAAAPVAAASAQRTVVAASANEDEITLPDHNKYILEKDPTKGEPVKMRTSDGKYVPEGELPAKLLVTK